MEADVSEDRLEQALEAMRHESVDGTTLDAVRTRVFEEVTRAAGSTCAEFRPDLPGYLAGSLGANRRVLLEDHLGRCPACRAAMGELKGERRVIAMPQRVASSRARRITSRWGVMAAAAALLLAVLYAGRDTIDAWMAPAGPRATVVRADGGVYRLSGEALAAGAAIGEGEIIRTAPQARAVLQLADGSNVDVNERTELFASAAWSGQAIHLQRGDIIVRAAKQRRGHLRVLTRDSIASVKGTIFAVSAGLGGSVVSVVEGSVAVSQPGTNVLLKPGQQAASSPMLATSIEDAVAWSPSAAEYLEVLASFVKIERQLAETFPTAPRTNSALLSYLPAGAFAYGAVPNLGGRISQALVLAEQQSLESAAFRAWWNSPTGKQLTQMVQRVQSVSSLLGDEIVFCASVAGSGEPIPAVIARVNNGSAAALSRELDELFTNTGDSVSAYSVTDDLMVVSSSPANLTWALGHLGQGADSPFAAAIGERYRRGAGWLMGIDAAPVIALAAGDDAPPVELAAMMGVKYLFLEQRAAGGAEENEVTLVFGGARTGMASWLADAGSGGASEYLAADALLAGYVSTREPLQLFQELSALVAKKGESVTDPLSELDGKLGAGFVENLTAAMGTEAAFSVNGLSVSGPTWTAIVLAYNPTTIDSSFKTIVDTFNAELAAGQQPGTRMVFTQETAGGRVWSTINGGTLPFGVTWTYDRGYMVAASDRATAERTIATRNGGSPLVWSREFLGQLPASSGIHPSAFLWVNTKGALGVLSTLSASPTLTKLLAERDPVLVVVDGKPNEIHAASRTQLSGVIMDVMLLQNLTGTHEGVQ